MENSEKSDEEGEILFFEDRTPGNISSIRPKPKIVELQHTVHLESEITESPESPDISEQGRDGLNNPLDLVRMEPEITESPQSPDISEQGRDGLNNPVCDMTDNRPTVAIRINESKDSTTENILCMQKYRNHLLPGQEICSSRYSINPKTKMEDSEKAGEEEELLFFEDRTPGDISSVRSKPKIAEPQNFISFKPENTESPLSPDISEQGRDGFNNTVCDETDNKCNRAMGLNESRDDVTEDILSVEEDRNPMLTGQETSSPRYSINENFRNLHNDNTPKPKRNKFANNCWNCGETTHSMVNCPEPRNRAEVARNRREFLESRGPQVVHKRYHVEDSQVFGHLIPGQLSDRLRQALGVEKRQLPCHIYNMRRLGYPPGWLLEAKVSHSGIAMFDGQGKEVNDPDTEAGEVVEVGSRDKYDIRKIIHYPGFNVPPPPGTYDDSSYWRCPPQSQHQSVEVMLARLEGKITGGYKRKKLSRNTTVSDPDDTSQSTESQEMEYEETPEGTELPEDHCKFVPPLPEEELPPPPPCELPSDAPSNAATPSVEDTSLTELEETKKRLLAQLNDTTAICGTPENHVGKVKSIDLGTPLLKSVSPYERLPSADKFSSNICDVINFENLPDSTGKYKKMSGVIRKVRVKLSKFNDES